MTRSRLRRLRRATASCSHRALSFVRTSSARRGCGSTSPSATTRAGSAGWRGGRRASRRKSIAGVEGVYELALSEMGHERTKNIDLVDHESRRREQDALVGEPHGGVGFAVHALEIDELEGSPPEIDRHPVLVLDVRGDEAVALEGR